MLPNGCVYTLIAYATLLHPVKALRSVFPMVMYPRLITLFFSFVSVTKSCVRYWHTNYPVPKAVHSCSQWFCTQDQYHCWHTQWMCTQDPCHCYHIQQLRYLSSVPSGCAQKNYSRTSIIRTLWETYNPAG